MDQASGRGAPPSAPIRDANGRFGPGNPGRPAGARGRMSRRIALGLLRHYADHEAEILERLSRRYFADYMRLIGQMLPRDPGVEAPDLQTLPPQDAARVTRAVRCALERVEAGQGSLDDVQAALEGLGCSDDPP